MRASAGEAASLPERPTLSSLSQGRKTITPHAGWRNSLKPQGPVSAELVLAEAGEARYGILLPETPTDTASLAAEELAFWLKEISGAPFSIVRESAVPRGGSWISIGATQLSRQLKGVDLDLKADGYRIGLVDDHLILLGGTRHGVLNAVMALLEEDLGCRWYHPDASATQVPRSRHLMLQVIERVSIPAFDTLRKIDYADVQDRPWLLRNRVRNGQWAGPFVHSYEAFVPRSRYFESHPEYFALINHERVPLQLDPLHPEVQQIVIAKINDWLKENPRSEFVDVSPNDGGGRSESAENMAVIQREGTDMGPLMMLVNAAADAIAQAHPEVFVTTLAYLNTVVPPRTFGPRANVMTWLATDAHAWNYNDLFVWETDATSSAMQLWHDRWKANLIVWDYPSRFHTPEPNFNLPVIAANLRWYLDRGAQGIYFQTNHNNNYGFPQSYQRAWLFSKLAWDPRRDTQELIRDFNFGFYGPAAEHLQAYDQMLWDAWEHWHATAVTDTPWQVSDPRHRGRTGWLTVDEHFWTRAEAHLLAAEEAVADQPVLLKRVRTARLPLMYLRLERGPRGDVAGYSALIDDFEHWARDAGLLILEGLVGPPMTEDLSKKLAYWRQMTRPLDAMDYIELSNTWRFSPDPEHVGLVERWFDRDYSDLAWHTLETGDWKSQGFASTKTGWYRQAFSVPDALLEQAAVWMLFGAVDETAEVFINGHLAFEHTVQSTGLEREALWNRAFVFDARPFLRPGRNQLTVRVTETIGAAGIWLPVRFISGEQKPDAQVKLDEIQTMLKIREVQERHPSH